MMIDRREVPLFCLYHLHMSFNEIADMDENCRCRRDHRAGYLDHYMRIWHHQFEKTGLSNGRSPHRGYVWELSKDEVQRVKELSELDIKRHSPEPGSDARPK